MEEVEDENAPSTNPSTALPSSNNKRFGLSMHNLIWLTLSYLLVQSDLSFL
jgi:hypothetical protein